jgi:hypothetical protein
VPFIDFHALRERVAIDSVASILPCKWEHSGEQLRATCPVHGGSRGLIVTPSKGLFICQSSPEKKKGGDCVGLYAHVMRMGNFEAAQALQEEFGAGTVDSTSHCTGDSTVSKKDATVPKAPTRREEKPKEKSAPFDPDKFWSHCTYSQELEDAGLSQEDCDRVLIGWHSRYKAHFIGSRNPDASISGFTKILDLSQVKFPPHFLKTNVVQLIKRPA